jgi:hypothetical protein
MQAFGNQLINPRITSLSGEPIIQLRMPRRFGPIAKSDLGKCARQHGERGTPTIRLASRGIIRFRQHQKQKQTAEWRQDHREQTPDKGGSTLAARDRTGHERQQDKESAYDGLQDAHRFALPPQNGRAVKRLPQILTIHAPDDRGAAADSGGHGSLDILGITP